MPKRASGSLLAPSNARSGYAKSADTRARILAAALAEASDSGIHETSVAAIAARAGVAVGSLNYHFGSREDLLRALMGSLTADLMSRLHATDANDDLDFFERERADMLVYLDHLRANPAYLRLAGEIELHEPKLYRRAVADWLARVTARIRAGIARGDLRPMDDAAITAQAYFMLGASQFFDHRVHRNGHPYPSDDAVVEAYLTLLRGGLGRGKPDAHRARTKTTSDPTARRVGRPRPLARPRSARR